MSRLPKGTKHGKIIEHYLVGLLYKDLPHPPGPYLALPPAGTIPWPKPAGVKYAYRPANGSYYNPLIPSLGMAGMPYARSVPTSTTIPASHLPDAATVFDTLLRRDQFVAHPGGLSSHFFAFANLLIHTVFYTSHADWSINDANSYLDLGPLYGRSEEQVNSVRRLDGSGKIWNDTFADPRLLSMPPSVGALLIIFSRNHNHIADKMLSINEKSTFLPLPIADPTAKTAQDDEIFNRARLVNTAFFMQVIVRDYIGVILGLVRDGSTWRLNPLEFARDFDHSLIPRGEGNVVSIEFNLLYRWHACTSQQDTSWTEQVFKKLFPGKEWDQITVAEFQVAAGKAMLPGPDVKAWTFGGLDRGPDGSFEDADIANYLQSATESAASAFKARGIPSVLRVIEIMGIEQGRAWGACSLNEFRKFVGLRPYESFEEWNPNPEIYQAAANLYQDIDHLELHVGLQAEETKVPMPGAGLCPGYTISRAILSDAICLTRGDRFMTTELTPPNLTTWGYNDCQVDENDGSFGGMLSKLLFRHLPEYYPPGSAYAHFPFMVPETMREYIGKLGCSSEDDYTWTRPIKTPLGLGSIENRVQKLFPYPLVSVKKPLFSSREVDHSAYSFFNITNRLIEERFALDLESTTRHLNIVGDVVNLVPIYWITEEIVDLSISTPTNLRGDVDPKDVYNAFSEVADYIFANVDSSRDWALHKASAETVHRFSLLIEVLLRDSADGLFNALKCFPKINPSEPDSLMRRLSRVFGGPKSVAASVFMETAATAALYSKAVALVINYIFNNSKVNGVHKNLHPRDVRGDGEVISLIREALHLQDLGHYWDKQILGVRPTETPLEDYGLLDPAFFEKTTVEILRAVFTRDDLVRRPNQPADMGSFNNQITKNHAIQSYLDDRGRVTPWPRTLIIHFDGHHAPAKRTVTYP
ncbi:heme peroxidase [Thelephora terrestris]|uniref:Heme peroxidase n=1 Tax=Thelephora terrestris TaxID=56493 RepID=A0A9P6HL62_9AGAM|nr:heme peroxidase [Thelephora terrestris]